MDESLFLLGKHFAVEWLDNMVGICFKKTADLFSSVVSPFYPPSAV